MIAMKSADKKARHRTKPTYHEQRARASKETTSYDHDTGVVFTETQVSGTINTTWVFDYKTPSIVKRTARPNPGPGCRSLYDMLIVKLGIEAQDLSDEALRGLPWKLGKAIWYRILENHAESFYLWRCFALAYPKGFSERDFVYTLDFRSPTLALTDYQRGITSAERHWLTCLRISPKQISIPDLVAISKITNLVALDLSDGQLHVDNRQSPFDARIMRSWSDLARQRYAFQHLEVLLLGWQEKVEHGWLFEHLKWFPSLRMIIITDCRHIDHKNHRDWEDTAWSYGWSFMPSKRGVKRLRSLFEIGSSYSANISNLLYDLANPTHQDLPSKPVLECSLGLPRTWSHIIDEFPGTRTVFFERTKDSFDAKRKDVTTQAPTTTRSKRECSSPVAMIELDTNKDDRQRRRKSSKLNTAGLLAQFS